VKLIQYFLENTVLMKLPNGNRAIVPIEKLRDYCLNSKHRVGRHKAYVFRRVLGLTLVDAKELRQKLLAIASTGEATRGRQDVYGERYLVDFELTTPEYFTRLTSCYVYKEEA
jgi:hypothetical protein